MGVRVDAMSSWAPLGASPYHEGSVEQAAVGEGDGARGKDGQIDQQTGPHVGIKQLSPHQQHKNNDSIRHLPTQHPPSDQSRSPHRLPLPYQAGRNDGAQHDNAHRVSLQPFQIIQFLRRVLHPLSRSAPWPRNQPARDSR